MPDSTSNTPPEHNTRRQFLQSLMGLAGATAVTAVLDKLEREPEAAFAEYEQHINSAALATPGSADVLERMRVELLRALEKPASERRWVMVIDLRKCAGCHACTVSCIAENKLPPGVVYRPVLEEEIGVYPNVTRRFIPRPCMQCGNPPCVPVCPVDATFTSEDGIVEVNYDQCIGCRACITACPYGARTSDFGYTYTEGTPNFVDMVVGQDVASAYETAPNFEYGIARSRKEHASPIGNARKCHFCKHRLAVGELPACVTTCIGRATLFGDANDPHSLVSELIAKQNVSRLKEELGTEPRVYYLS